MSILLNILLMVAGLKITFKTADIDRFYSCDENEQLDRDPCHFLDKNNFFSNFKGWFSQTANYTTIHFVWFWRLLKSSHVVKHIGPRVMNKRSGSAVLWLFAWLDVAYEWCHRSKPIISLSSFMDMAYDVYITWNVHYTNVLLSVRFIYFWNRVELTNTVHYHARILPVHLTLNINLNKSSFIIVVNCYQS